MIAEKVIPDVCTSFHCTPPQDHCIKCSHAIYMGEIFVKGRRWSFEFNPMFGVTFTNAGGEFKKIQPKEDNPVWEVWRKWHDDKFNRGESCQRGYVSGKKEKDNVTQVLALALKDCVEMLVEAGCTDDHTQKLLELAEEHLNG